MVYNYLNFGQPNLWKVPIGGGEPVQITDCASDFGTISPDGKLILFRYQAQNIVTTPFERQLPIRSSDVTVPEFSSHINSTSVRWTSDSRALSYVETRDGVSNIWLQPLDGSAPHQLTNFTAEQIFSHDWSRDGKDLVCTRGVLMNDVVIIRDFR